MRTAFQRGTVNHMRIHVLPTDRFKTYAISVYIGSPLSENTVTSHALTPFVLRRGSEDYPETAAFRQRLDDLYGAGFGFDVYKRGDAHIVQLRMDMIEESYVKAPANELLQDALQFIGGTLTRPLTENHGFRDKYVQSEKATLKKRIEASVNDKIRYAAERCIEEMCKDEAYRLSPLGLVDRLEQIRSEDLYAAYEAWISSSPIDIYVVGKTTLEEVSQLVSSAFVKDRTAPEPYRTLSGHREVVQESFVQERMDIGQGKLNIGLRCYTAYADEYYPAMLMYNGILGAYPHSKLFTNVREKASLAYYASSRLEGHKGIITVQSGIEIANKDKAVDIIKLQLKSLAEGEITEVEMQQTKAMITNQLREMQDSAYEMIAYDFNSVLSGRERTAEELISAVNSVTVQDVQKAAGKVKLDTIYFLTDLKEGQHGHENV